MDTKRSLEQRLQTTALVAQNVQDSNIIRDLRQMTHVLVRGLLAAVREVRNHLAQWKAPGQADAYVDAAEAPRAREALEAYAAAIQDAAAAAALAEAQTWGRAETRAAEIETLLALKHRHN